MTGPALPSTSIAATPRQVWTRSRGLLLGFTILLVAGIAIAAIRSGGQHGRLDPRSADPYGSRAVSELLADRGVTTRVVTTAKEAAAATGPDSTLLVTSPDLLTRKQRSAIRSASSSSAGRTVLVAPGPPSVDTLAPGVRAEQPSNKTTLQPNCPLPQAKRAGNADTGGIRFATSLPHADSCYPSEGLPTLLQVPSGRGETVLLGAPDLLYNERLDKHGNASLALQLLGSRPHLVWYLPSISDSSAADTGDRSFFELIPSDWRWAALQLAIATALAALWRGRRLGPLVPERLPVVIRASEAVEGRARLYSKTKARARAAKALRAATRSRLAPLVGVAPGRAHTPETLLPAVSAQLPTTWTDLQDTLFGPPPSDDAALVALADRLDALEGEVRTS